MTITAPRYALRVACPSIRGVTAAIAGYLSQNGCNISDSAQVEGLVPAAEAAMGQVDILIANAGITRDNLFVQLRDEDWDDVIQVNLTATFRLARAATPTTRSTCIPRR